MERVTPKKEAASVATAREKRDKKDKRARIRNDVSWSALRASKCTHDMSRFDSTLVHLLRY